MHLSEGLLPAGEAASFFLVSCPFVAVSYMRAKRFFKTASARGRAAFNLACALTFAVTLFPIPVPGVGATSHMCATPFLAILFGPIMMVFPVVLVLLAQALFFAHGGLSTLGANVFTLGIAGPLATFTIFFCMSRMNIPTTISVFTSCFLGSLFVYAVDAVILGVALKGTQPFLFWFCRISLAFLPIQLPLAVLEGALSAGLYRFLAKSSPDLLRTPIRSKASGIAALLIACLSLCISSSARASSSSDIPAGLDEVVFETLALEAGHKPSSPFLDLQGDHLLSAFALGFFVAGCFVGRITGNLQLAGSDRAIPDSAANK